MHKFYFDNKLLPIFALLSAAVALVHCSLGHALGQDTVRNAVQNPLKEGPAASSSDPVYNESQEGKSEGDGDQAWNDFDSKRDSNSKLASPTIPPFVILNSFFIDCEISDEDASDYASAPWLAIMRISENEDEESEMDKYW